MNKVGVSFFFLTALVGCGTHAYQTYGLYDRSDAYLNSEPSTPFIIPDDIRAIKSSDQYTIPAISEVDISAPAPSLLPPAFDELPAEK